MAEAISYCERCGKLIPPSELGKAGTIVTPEGALCAGCAGDATPEELARFLPSHAASQATRERPARRASASRPGPPRGRQTRRAPAGLPDAEPHAAETGAGSVQVKIAVAGAGGGLLLGLAATLLVMRGPGDAPPSGPAGTTPPTTRDRASTRAPDDEARIASPESHPAGAGGAGPAGRRLAALRSVAGPSLRRYGEARKALASFPDEFPGTPEAEEAQRLLTDLDARYAKLARKALERATTKATVSAARNEFDEAVEAIRSVAKQFGEGVWLESEGRRAIEQAVAEIEKLRSFAAAAEARRLAFRPELVGHWRFDDMAGTAASDSSGKGQEGRLVNGAGWRKGKLAGGVSFDGENAYVEVPSSPALRDVQEGDYTITAWVRPASKPSGAGVADNRRIYGIVIKTGDAHLGLQYTHLATFRMEHLLAGTPGKLDTDSAFPPGRFHHVAAVVAREAGTAVIYVDGKAAGSQELAAGASAPDYGAAPWRIGIAAPGAGQYRWAFDGVIDDVRIYNHAVAADEIARLFHAASVAVATSAGLDASPADGAPGGGSQAAAESIRTGIAKADLDPGAFAEWAGGGGGAPQGKSPESIFVTRDGRLNAHASVVFGKSRGAGPRHLRIGFNRSVAAGTVVTKAGADVEVSVLKEDAAYPGDLADDAQWTASWRPRRAEMSVWTLPRGTTTRALRFSHRVGGDDKEYSGELAGVMVLPSSFVDVSPDASPAVSSRPERAPKLVDGGHDTHGQWHGSAGNDVVSERNPVGVLLTWPGEREFRGLCAVSVGFAAVRVEAYEGDGEPSPTGGDEWRVVGTYATQNLYPQSMELSCLDFGETVKAGALRLVITRACDDGRLHPHKKGHAEGGKVVWLGDVLALEPIASSKLAGFIERVCALPGRVAADTATDGYYLDQAVLLNLAKRFDAKAVTAKRLAAVGGAAAASSSFDRTLMGDLRPADGYSFASRLGVARRNMTPAALLKGLDRCLAREKPEIVRICFDSGALAGRAKASELKPEMLELVARVLDRGAVPVLYTLPVPPMRDERAQALIEEYNAMVVAVAKETSVPCLDAHGALNRDRADLGKHFTSGGGLRAGGYELLSGVFLKLYRVAEAVVMGRGEKPTAP